MDWYVVDKKYINYLTQFDSRVGYVEYGERLKLHVGILLTIGDFHYYVPISSAKPKYQKMSNSLDFHKLQDESTGYLYAVLNINNMIPVPDNCLTQLKYNQVESFRSFSNEKEKTDYSYINDYFFKVSITISPLLSILSTDEDIVSVICKYSSSSDISEEIALFNLRSIPKHPRNTPIKPSIFSLAP